MGNDYFQFKSFRIAQDRCAMKVTTDACILGAWIPISSLVKDVLDIGAGTGLLSVMLAQRCKDIYIHAIEIDADTVIQLNENIALSPWNDRIQAIQGDVRQHNYHLQYDMVIVNPPFFNDSLLGVRDNKNIARHTISLSYQELLKAIDKNLRPQGYACILLPLAEYKVWKELFAINGWQEQNTLMVRHQEKAPAKRVISIMGRAGNDVEIKDNTLVIMNYDGTYTAQFRKLLQDFYLDF